MRDALERMPHRGPMLLIETVLEADGGGIRCRARDHRAPDYPLRVGGRLPALCLVELGAQAAAAHASLFGIGASHVGLLLALRRVDVAQDDADALPGPLDVAAEVLASGDAGARYAFRVLAGDRPVVAGEALLSMREAGK